MEIKAYELEINEEMMSDFEKGFWQGAGIVGGVTVIGGIIILT